MKLTIQPKFSWMATRDRPSINRYKRTQELLKNFNRDYAIEVYFKENGRAVRRSRYTMGELAHHLMVEGQYSTSANRMGRPHAQMSVVYGKNGRPRRNRAGKYLLQNETGYKKIWNFVKTGAQKHHNWRARVMQMTTAVLFNRLALFYMRKPLSSANFYNEMKALARQILSDLKQELLALEYPALDPKTIKKKKSDKILIESKKLFNALAVRVVPLKSKPKTRINFGRKFSQGNQKLSFEEIEQLKEYLATKGDKGAQEEFFKSARIKEDARKALRESEDFDETVGGAEEASDEEAEEASDEEYDSEQREDDSITDLGEFLYRNT